jgi:hypothetical protein
MRWNKDVLGASLRRVRASARARGVRTEPSCPCIAMRREVVPLRRLTRHKRHLARNPYSPHRSSHPCSCLVIRYVVTSRTSWTSVRSRLKTRARLQLALQGLHCASASAVAPQVTVSLMHRPPCQHTCATCSGPQSGQRQQSWCTSRLGVSVRQVQAHSVRSMLS